MRIKINPRELPGLKTLESLFPKTRKKAVLYEIGDALAFIFQSQTTMCLALARLEELSEHPGVLRGKIPFTHKDIWECSPEQDYMQWQGFNVGLDCITPFLDGKFDPLTKDEELIIEPLREKDRTKYQSIIATHIKSDGLVLLHEIGHWLYLHKEYTQEVQALLAQFPDEVRQIKEILRKYNAYHESFLDDEVHAYVFGNSPLARIQIPRELIPNAFKNGMREILWKYYEKLNP
jgi:hypothetical protein